MSPVCSVTYVSGWTPLPNLPRLQGAPAKPALERNNRWATASLPEQLLAAAEDRAEGEARACVARIEHHCLAIGGLRLAPPPLAGQQVPEARVGVGEVRAHFDGRAV